MKLLNYVKFNQKNISLIRVTNSFFKSYLINKGIKKEKIFQIPIAVDTKKFKYRKNKNFYRKKFNLPKDKILIGSFHKDGEGWDYGEKPKIIKGTWKYIPTNTGLLKFDEISLPRKNSNIFSTLINAIAISTKPVIKIIQKKDLIK